MQTRLLRVEGATFLTGGLGLERPQPPPANPSRIVAIDGVAATVASALQENRELIEFEFALTRLAEQRQLRTVVRAVIAFVASVVASLIGLSAIVAVVVLALGASSTIALVAAAVLIAVGAASGAFGASLLAGFKDPRR